MIKVLQDVSVAYNPIREHISLRFELCDDDEQKLYKIYKYLRDLGMNPKISRALVFVRTRKLSEELVARFAELQSKLENSDDKLLAGYFHAGLNSEERQEIYESFRNGSTPVLFATKAFGMGMDIQNIHFIFHFGPSGTFEDYLQEVGRAGRDSEQLKIAGFSPEKPIDAVCFYVKDDFKKLKDLLHRGRISWDMLEAVFNSIIEFHEDLNKSSSSDPIVIPFNFLSKYSQFDDLEEKETFFRLALYWLERLQRIRLGFYAPEQLLFTKFEYPNEAKLDGNKEKALVNLLAQYFSSDKKQVQIDINELTNTTTCRNFSELHKLVLACQRKGYLRVENIFVLKPTSKKSDELKYSFSLKKDTRQLPSINALFSLAHTLLSITKSREQISVDEVFWATSVRQAVTEYISLEQLPWLRSLPEQERIKRLENDRQEFVSKKAKFAFALLSIIPKIKHKTVIEHGIGHQPKIQQLIYNGTKKNEEWQVFLKQFKNDLINLIEYVSRIQYSENRNRHNLSDLLIDLNLDHQPVSYVENLFLIAKWLGYLKCEGSVMPMGIETTLENSHSIKIEDKTSEDGLVNMEFEKTQTLRQLRLIALEALSQVKQKDKIDSFITKYFTCASIEDILELIENNLGNDHPSLSAFRDEALLEAYGALSEEQKSVYDEAITRNVQVIAGPGSGKTHTLVLRVARLIHKEGIRPENILVLAYNRAVIVELKERLRKLFNALGYSNITNRLKVFTFHGLCRYCLPQEMNQVALDSWISSFLNVAKLQPGVIHQRLGNISHVFVDEFQDITEERLNVLQVVANPARTKITVIGDPNQSIYGYERVNAGGARSPSKYYAQFKTIYNPEFRVLSTNYRSLPLILSSAEELLNTNFEKFGVDKLSPARASDRSNYVSIIDYEKVKTDWMDCLKNVLEEVVPETGRKHRQIAILFRSNDEVYRALNKINKENLQNVRIRIIGESGSFTRIREIHYVLRILGKYSHQLITETFNRDLENIIQSCIQKYPKWDRYYFDILRCLFLEFRSEGIDNSTVSDFLSFVEEFGAKDDGQISKVMLHRGGEIGISSSAEIILTTIHKVKGLEFDAVLIPASFQSLKNTTDVKDYLDEERRLLYVAYTRARNRLIVINWWRENYLAKNIPFEFPTDVINLLGIPIKQGFDKYFISWGGTAEGDQYFSQIEQNIVCGQSVQVKKVDNKWFAEVNGVKVGRLSNSAATRLNNQCGGASIVSGFTITNLYIWTFEETVRHDAQNNPPTTFANFWTSTARQRGYLYLVEFAGFGTIN